MSQNHSAERLKLVISQLEQSTNEDEREIASHMKTILRKLKGINVLFGEQNLLKYLRLKQTKHMDNTS